MNGVGFAIGVVVGQPAGRAVLLPDALLCVTPTKDVSTSVTGGRA